MHRSAFIKRRISSLLSRFNSKSIVSETYQILNQFMHQNENIVVRVSAAFDLRICLDDWQVDGPHFMQHAEQAINSLIQLLRDLDENETQKIVIETLSHIIERMDRNITSFCEPLIDILSKLWSESENQNLYRASLISIFEIIVVVNRN